MTIPSNQDMALEALGLGDIVRKARRAPKAPKSRKVRVSRADVAAIVHAVAEHLLPKAPQPPRFTPETWAATCMRREVRCRLCELCAWEHEAERWHAVSPWGEGGLKLPYQQQPTTFRNVDAALLAFVSWERHNRWTPSAMGPLLERISSGSISGGKQGTNYKPDREDPLLRKANDVVDVRRAVEVAFVGSKLTERWGLGDAECLALLVARVGGVLEKLPTYEELGAVVSLPASLCKALVRHGRRSITVELAARGMIPMPAKGLGWHWDIDVRRTELTPPLTGSVR